MDEKLLHTIQRLAKDPAAAAELESAFRFYTPHCGSCEERLCHAFDRAPVGMMTLSPQGKILTANLRLNDLLGVPVEGRFLSELIHAESCTCLNGLIAAAQSGQATSCADIVFIPPGPSLALLAFSPVEGNCGCMLALVVDESARRSAEERARQAEKLASLGTMVSGMAHEVNNPTHVLSLHLQRLERAWSDASAILDSYHKENGDFLLGGLPWSRMRQDSLATFEATTRAVHRIEGIVKDLLTFARPLSASEVTTVDVERLLFQVVTRVEKSSSPCPGIKIRVEVPKDLPPLRACGRKLDQALFNLVENARQAMAEANQSGSIVVRAQALAKTMVFQIIDTGPGIDHAILERVREPFFTTRRTKGGTGLGLWVVDSVASEHGGRFTLESPVGQGTTATMEIPR